jgi:DUF4097 and DUF4098 domain-containing protein YvlB
MRRRSLTGPLILVIIGGLFLWRNFHPEAPIYEIIAQDWPFLLILWGLLRLVEVMWPGNQGRWRSGFTGGEVVLIVLICIVGSGFWAGFRHGIGWHGPILEVFGQDYDYSVSAKAPANGMKRIVFDNPRGNIKVTGADTADVTVTGQKTVHATARTDAERTQANTPVEIVPEGDHLLIRTNQDRAPDDQRMSDDLEVTVPKGMAVEARGRSGDYEVSDVNGDVMLASSHGDARLSRVAGNARVEMNRSDTIRAVDVKGRLDLQGQGSDIYLENIGGQVTINGAYSGELDFKNLAKPLQFEGTRNTELHVEAVPGHINMDLGQFTGVGLVGPTRLVTRSRDIKVAQFTNTLNIDVEHGNVEITPSLPLQGIEARSGYGNIELALPEKASFQLNATATRGDATNDFGAAIHKETDGQTNILKANVGNGPTVRLTADRGSVEVTKAGDVPNPPEAPPKPPAPKSPKDIKDSEIKL